MPIENVRVGDIVKTSNGLWKPVTAVMGKQSPSINKIRVQGAPEIHATDNHPFYVRHLIKTWNNSKRQYDYSLGKAEWVDVKDIIPGDRVSIPVNTLINKLEITENEAWILGRYLADGYRIDAKRGGNHGRAHKTVISVRDTKIPEFKEKANSVCHFTYSKEGRHVYKAIASDKRLFDLTEQFGQYADKKTIPGEILGLPNHLLAGFLSGYLAGDGSYNSKKDEYSATTTSKLIVLGLTQITSKLYHVIPTITLNKVPKTTIIEGRTVNQKPFYMVRFRKQVSNRTKFTYENGVIWTPVKSITHVDNWNGGVFNLEVESEHTYTANGIGVHNCQSFLIAGKRLGFADKTRGTLFFEIARAAKQIQPRYLFLENVKGLLSHDKGRTFQTILSTLDEIGYDAEWQVCNSKNFGVPQNRERVIIIGHLRGKRTTEVFFDSTENGSVTSSNPKINDLLPVDSPRHGRRGTVLGTDGISSALQATDYKTPKQILQVGNIMQASYFGGNPQTGRVYDPAGLSPTLNTMSGGGREPKNVVKGVAIKSNTKAGYEIAHPGDGINFGQPNSKTRRGRVQMGGGRNVDHTK